MAQPFPYTYYACDCFDASTTTSKRASQNLSAADTSPEHETFDPRSPRSAFSLFPLEHLLYCDECQQMRCPRCVLEETLNWYCPSCLFEVPSSVVKSDGNRCTRNCFNCPVCTAPMMTSSLDASGENGPPYILACPYCRWSSLEVGIEFEKSTGISAQLARVANGGRVVPSAKEREKERERRKEVEERRREGRTVLSPTADSPTMDEEREEGPPGYDEVYASLGAFYKGQVEAQMPANPFSQHDINYASPSAYSRIVNLYSSTKKNKRAKPNPFREAASALEGLSIHDPATDAAAIERIKQEGWAATLSPAVKQAQLTPNIRFTDELRPVATLLCTKRSKRCRSCRHILSKPETKVTSTRYKIKLLALNHIPRLSIRALPPNPAQPVTPGNSFNYNALKSGIPTHFLLHLSNPLFDPIRVTLATPSTTPGKVQSRVTILCPQFEVGANTDVWDDALASTLSPINRNSLINDAGQIEAGKIWDRGRNWTSVVIEVVPGFLKPVGVTGANVELDEDDDVLEIPIFVRLEFEADVAAEERGLGDSRGSKGERERREEAFWTVVGAGRIAAA